MSGGGIHLCRPATWWGRTVRDCPTCGSRRRFVVMLQEWYGAVWTCCGCGDSWSDGQRHERPFARGWRDRERHRARDRWNAATSLREAAAAMTRDLPSLPAPLPPSEDDDG